MTNRRGPANVPPPRMRPPKRRVTVQGHTSAERPTHPKAAAGKKKSLLHAKSIKSAAPLLHAIAAAVGWPANDVERGAGGENAVITPTGDQAEFRVSPGLITFSVTFAAGRIMIELATASLGSRAPCHASMRLHATGAMEAERAIPFAHSVMAWAHRLQQAQDIIVTADRETISREIAEAVRVWSSQP